MASKIKKNIELVARVAPPNIETSFHKTLIPNPKIMDTDICKTISQYKTKLGSDLLPPSVLPNFLFKLDIIKPTILKPVTRTRIKISRKIRKIGKSRKSRKSRK